MMRGWPQSVNVNRKVAPDSVREFVGQFMARPSERHELRFHDNLNFFENSVSSFPYKKVTDLALFGVTNGLTPMRGVKCGELNQFIDFGGLGFGLDIFWSVSSCLYSPGFSSGHTPIRA